MSRLERNLEVVLESQPLSPDCFLSLIFSLLLSSLNPSIISLILSCPSSHSLSLFLPLFLSQISCFTFINYSLLLPDLPFFLYFGFGFGFGLVGDRVCCVLQVGYKLMIHLPRPP